MRTGIASRAYSAPMPIRVFVVRHGKAEHEAPSGLDADRGLTPGGHVQARWIADQLKLLTRPAASHLLVSPIRRARQTAAAIEAALVLTATLETRLATDRRVSDVLHVVQEFAANERRDLVIVGHNPHFEGFIGAMLGRGPVSMRTGEMVGLRFASEIEPGKATSFGVWRHEEE